MNWRTPYMFHFPLISEHKYENPSYLLHLIAHITLLHICLFIFLLSTCIFSLFLMSWPVYFIWFFFCLEISVYNFYNCYQLTKAFVRFTSTLVILYIEILQTVSNSEALVWVCNDIEEERETCRPLHFTSCH